MTHSLSDRELDAFQRLCADLRRCPALVEDDIEFYIEATRSRLAHTPGDLPPPERQTPSPRELQILSCASYGMTTKMTATTLGIATDTVVTHLAHVRAKLRAKTTAQAVGNAIRRKLIP